MTNMMNNKQMNMNLLMRAGIGMLVLAWISTSFAAELSEQDYFSELPTVLTVSRLAQPLNEAPGAVTVIDRETIRRSGARELVDVLRLVPGYLVGGFNGANPSASYHAPMDDYGIRNLVLIDGRPVYSAYYFGGTSRGMMGLLLEDIERIEVLRGSNSAAYGANALFGVINIITRNAVDTRGAEVSFTGGDGGIKDNYARYGWGNETASFRLSTGRRSDSGYGGAHDDKTMSQLHFRSDLRPTLNQELMFAAGVAQLAAGDGFLDSAGNPERTVSWRNISLQGSWKRQLSETEEIKFSASFNEETLRDSFGYEADPSVVVSSSGYGRRFNLEFQHQLALTTSIRAVWGVGYKHENAVSRPLYYTSDAVTIHEERLFGSLEWRLHPQWLINAGAFGGNHSWTGSYLSPRLMANFFATPDHTFRLGVTESSRTPTLFELASDVRLLPRNVLGTPLTYPPPNNKLVTYLPYFAAMGQPVRLFASSGNLNPEKLYSQEIGYFGNLRALRLTVDLRAYIEKMRDVIAIDPNRYIPGYLSGVIPAGTITTLGPLPFSVPVNAPLPVTDFVNTTGFETRGLEYQLRWRPFDTTEIWVNQAFQKTFLDGGADNPYAPTHATTIAWFQKLPHDWDLSVIHQSTGSMTWNARSDALPSVRRLDMRMAKRFMIGSTRAEASVAVQAMNGDLPAYQTGTSFTFERRAFGTLRIEF